MNSKLLAAALWLAVGMGQNVIAAGDLRSIFISEFLIKNEGGLKDDDGKRDPWMELYNNGNTVVNLRGWFLTDDTNNLTKWSFPHVSLLPDKYLVVFASGQNRTNPLASIHTSFRLSESTKWLALVDRNTNVVSEFTVTNQRADVSFGYIRAEPGTTATFLRPTPGKPNATKGAGFAPAVSFSRPGGTFLDSVALRLSSRADRAVIRYTLDGTLPSTNSSEYVAPLLITNTVQVRARSFEPGLLPGPPQSECFVRLNESVSQFTSTLPILVMNTFGRSAQTRHGPFVYLSFFEPDHGKTSLTNPPALSVRGGFHIRGSTSARMAQPAFAMHFVDEYNEDEAHPALGLPADADWVLYAPTDYDSVLIHNPFIHQLSRDMGQYSPRTRFVEVFLSMNSGPVRDLHYAGLYVLQEKIKISPQRVNIARMRREDIAPPDVTGGYLLKFDRLGPGENGFWAGGAMVAYVDPHEEVLNLPQWSPQRRYLDGFFKQFEAALFGPEWLDPARGYRAYLDVDAMIDYHVLEVLSGNVDSGIYSTFFYKPRGGKLVFGPHWDFDRALGSIDRRDEYPRHWNTGRFFRAEWWQRFCSDLEFWQQWVDRWQELRQTHFSISNLNALADRLAAEIKDAQPRQYRKWGFQPRGGSYQSEVDLMKDWLANRIDFIDQQLAQPPQLQEKNNRTGRVVTFTAETNATVYYTVDGSDPRLPQGRISSKAIPYTGPIDLKAGTRLTARVLNPNRRQVGGPPASTPWSGRVTSSLQ